MAAPNYVPVEVPARQRYYVSPPRRDGQWLADRPGELQGRQPTGSGLGAPGPDQGYCLGLARRLQHKLLLAAGENSADVVAGCVAVALKRASSFGRAPILVDVEMALQLFGFLPPKPDSALVKWRKELFVGLRHQHHYADVRRLVDLVSVDVLCMTAEALQAACEADRSQLVVRAASKV